MPELLTVNFAQSTSNVRFCVGNFPRLNSSRTCSSVGVSNRPGAAPRRVGVGGFEPFTLGHAARFDYEMAGPNQAHQLGIAKLSEQPPHVAINWLLGQVLIRPKSAGDSHNLDPRIDRPGQQGDASTLAATHHAQGRSRCPATQSGPILATSPQG